MPIAGLASAAERTAYIARVRASPVPLMLLNAVGDDVDANSNEIVSLEPAVGDKRRALDEPDTDDDDRCAEQFEGAGAPESKPEQDEMRNKKLGTSDMSRSGDKRSARDAPDTSDDDGSRGRTEYRGMSKSEVRDEREQAEMRSKELRRGGEARNLSREERKMLAIVRQIEAMEHKEKTVKAVSEAGAWPPQLEGRGGHGNQKVGEKRRVREACDTGGGEAARQQQQGKGGGGAWAGGEALKVNPAKFSHTRKDKVRKVPEDKGALKIKRVKCPEIRITDCKQYGGSIICEHNRRRSRCKQCGGSGICEHNRERNKCKQCGGASICEHNRERNKCKQCGGAGICEHNRIRSLCKSCGGASICEHNRQRSRCKQCGGSSICEHNRQRSKCMQCGGASMC